MKNKSHKKGVTLDELANMVARGFEQTSTKAEVSELSQRVSKVEWRMSKLEFQNSEMHEILARFEDVDVVALQRRVKVLERAVKTIVRKAL